MKMNTNVIALGMAALLPFALAAMAAMTEPAPAPAPTPAPAAPPVPGAGVPAPSPVPGAPPPHPMHHEGFGGAWIEKTTDMLKTNLALSDDQTKHVHDILEGAHREGMKEREKTGEDVNGLFKAAEDRHRMTDEKIAAVLTPEQRTKYDANKEQWRRTAVHDEIVGHLKTDLNLTDPQVAQVSEIVTTSQDRLAEARKASAGDETKTLEAVKTIHNETEAKIEGVLTPEQKTKYAELKEEHRTRRHAFLHHDEPMTPKS